MRVVVKIGTSTLSHKTGKINIMRFEKIVKVMSDLKNAGYELMIVSSGAIGMGVGKLMLGDRPKVMAITQAAAAVGQCELMYTYDKLFAEYNHNVGQILLSSEDLNQEERRKNIHNTLNQLLKMEVLPIVNENDSVATDEIKFGDNDTLAAVVAKCAEADLLVLLTDIDGLYTEDPHQNPNAEMLNVVEKITPEIKALAGETVSKQGTGGMITKLRAAEIVTEAGIDMVIANGSRPEILYDILDGKMVGTRFIGRKG